MMKDGEWGCRIFVQGAREGKRTRTLGPGRRRTVMVVPPLLQYGANASQHSWPS